MDTLRRAEREKGRREKVGVRGADCGSSPSFSLQLQAKSGRLSQAVLTLYGRHDKDNTAALPEPSLRRNGAEA